MDDTSSIVIGNSTDVNEIALKIMSWESDYFYNPYRYYDKNSTLQRHGIFNYSEDVLDAKLFWRKAPAPWIIHFGTANCEEYARIFVEMMRHNGMNARMVHSPAGDHCWAEYRNANGNWVTVDPSMNNVIGNSKAEFVKRMNRDFCYVEAIDENGNKIDVSSQYVNISKVTVKVLQDGKLKGNCYLRIYNRCLMETREKMYDKPIRVLEMQDFDDSDTLTLGLGSGNYTFILVEYPWSLFGYQKPITVCDNEPIDIAYNLNVEKKDFIPTIF